MNLNYYIETIHATKELNDSFIKDLREHGFEFPLTPDLLIRQLEINNILLEAFLFAKLSESIIEDKNKKEE